MSTHLRHPLALAALVACLTWTGSAAASVCNAGGWVSKIASTTSVAAAGIPAYFSPDARVLATGGISTAGRLPTSGDDRPGFELGSTVQGYWDGWGYRADFFSLQRGDGCTQWFSTHLSGAASYIARRTDRSEVRVSVGGGYGFMLGPSLDLGVTGQYNVGNHLGLEGRLRYLPHFTGDGAGRAPPVRQVFRTRLLAKWRTYRGFQPFVGLTAGLTGTRQPQMQPFGPPDEPGPGLYVTGLVGLQSNWGGAGENAEH